MSDKSANLVTLLGLIVCALIHPLSVQSCGGREKYAHYTGVSDSHLDDCPVSSDVGLGRKDVERLAAGELHHDGPPRTPRQVLRSFATNQATCAPEHPCWGPGTTFGLCAKVEGGAAGRVGNALTVRKSMSNESTVAPFLAMDLAQCACCQCLPASQT
jgi:hypothetical protein